MAVRVSVAFSKTEVRRNGNALEIRCDVANRSREPWRSEDGWAVGYHLIDEPTGTLVVDGEHAPLNLAAGQSRVLTLEVPLPPEPGDYNIYVSLLREHVAWFYTTGWPFLLIDASVGEDGAAELQSWRVADQKSVARRRAGRSFRRAVTLPIASIWRNRSLIRTLVRRDVLSRYTGSFGGAFWAVLNPLLLMLTYFFVFGLVLRSRFGSDPSRAGFAVYFLAGMLPWLAFSEAVGRAPFILVEHRGFIKKLVFPVETLPVNLVASGLVTEFFGTLLFVLALLIVRGRIPATVVFLPALLVPQILLTAGICWFISALGVFVRDLTQINGYLLTIWFFITPICYEEKNLHSLPRSALALLTKNPLYILVRGYRSILLESKAPDWNSLAWLFAFSLAVFLFGHAWFYKLRKSFADLI
ncbi:MAG TPA: ABC transporter permease [Bryobacteraceae bacterium]|nr:ABC transporter permease [Bryobacteraceae bacterium]